jgi:type I pantothenate kinase
MDQRADTGLSPYRVFSRAEWAARREDTPMTLTPDEVVRLRSLNDRLDIREVEEIYLPLSRLLSFYVAAALPRHRGHQDALCDRRRRLGRGGQVDHRPRVAGPAGALVRDAEGRSRDHRWLSLSECRFGAGRPDGEEGLSRELRSRHAVALPLGHQGRAPPGARDRPDILIVEGLNVLQTGRPPKDGKAIPFVSDFFDFSIYIDADEDVLRTWYIDRFMTLRETAFRDPKSYFHKYAAVSDAEALDTATSIWNRINLVNLRENILPTRQRADLILKKGASHMIEEVALRRL